MCARRRSDAGFALLMVLGTLAMVALIAAQLASRVDDLRARAASLQELASARAQADSAQAVVLYALATAMPGPAGFATEFGAIVADGRYYTVGNAGAQVAVLDERGLVPLNVAPRVDLERALLTLGIPPEERATLLDVLEDFKDPDTLRRANGAEAPEYLALGLPPPRNDWLHSVRELARMPAWRDRPELLVASLSVFSARRSGEYNPNVAPLPVLQALIPTAGAEQLRLFDTLRKQQGVPGPAAVRTLTGLSFDDDRYLFFASLEHAITVWVPGLPRARRIHLVLTPGELTGPWRVQESYSVPRPASVSTGNALNISLDRPRP
jgi:general secretion pathway protein K